MYDLMVSVVDRWNAAGLNNSIAPLYPAGEGRSATRNRAGSPEGTDAPRAEYFVSVGAATNKTRASRLYQGAVVIQVWSADSDSAGQYATDIYDAFVNADEAGMVMSAGTVLEVEDGGGFVHKEDDEMYLTQQTVLVRYRRENP